MSLKKELSLLDVFCIATGAMISSGIFILPGLAFSQTGPAVFLSYFVAGILALAGILSVVELSTAMPKAGGDYYFINRSLGPFVGTISGFLGWLALSLKSAFAIYGISEIIKSLMGIDQLISSIFVCLFFVLLNILGVKSAAKFQVTLVISLLILMTLYSLGGFFKLDISHYKPFAPHGYNAIFFASGFIFISFGGLLKVASVSEEVKDPRKNIPIGMIASIIAVTLLYTVLLFVTVGVLKADTLKNSLTPIADAAENIIGRPGFILISIAAFLAFFTTANAGMMSASRYPLALSRDNLLPKGISKVSKRFNTPIISILITGGFISLSFFLPLETLVKAASSVVLTSYVLTSVSVIILRESKLSNYKPSFKTPFYPWIQIFGIIIFSIFIIKLGLQAVEISLSFLILSILIYYFYGRKKFKGEYALLHLIKRVANNILTEHLLEKELREIIIDRDNIELDKFDNLVKVSEFIDLDENMDLDEFFFLISKKLSEHTSLGMEKIYQTIVERQKQCNMAVSPFVAIPHIILDEIDDFVLMLIRSKNGIKFSDQEDSVKAVFVFAGSKEDREFHLKTLASIATLVQEPDFEEKWINAKNSEYLRDMILLSKRKRFHGNLKDE